MPRSSYQQNAFLGGEFNPLSQGRSELPIYKQAMNLSLNGYPVEEGAWLRRSGFEFLIPTRNRTYAWMIPFQASSDCSFVLLFTDDNLQFLTQSSLIFDNTVSTITAMDTSIGEVTFTPAQSDWVDGDQVMLVFPDGTSSLSPYPIDLELGLRNRMLTIKLAIDSTHLLFADDLGDSLGGDGTVHMPIPSGALVGAQIMRVLNLATTYSGVQTLQNLRGVQIEYDQVILSSTEPPNVVEITTPGSASADPVFTFSSLGLVDGPYLDPSGDTGTVSALSGTANFTASTTTPFAATDVGRHLRLFSQPALWAGGTTYAAGDLVTDSTGAWWTSLVSSNTGNTPGQPVTINSVQQLAWAPNLTAGSWAWGVIATYVSSSEVSFTYDTTIPNMVLQAANGDTITTFQLGVFTSTPYTGTNAAAAAAWPTCGLWDQGRLILGGAVQNRFDTTISNGEANGIATFSPTDPWGNVLDSSGMSEVFNAETLNFIQWMKPEEAGWLMGTLNGEFLVFSSATNDAITPTNIGSRRASKLGSGNIEPVSVAMTTVFVQKFGRRVIEYFADAFSGKFSGRHLNEYAEHLTSSGVAQIAYQEETTPIIWARMNNGLLASCTYRRFTRFVSEPPNIQGWARHLHGRQRSFTAICTLPGKGGLLDRLFTVTNDPSSIQVPAPVNYFVEILQPGFDVNQTVLAGWFCDEAPGPGPGNSGDDCGGGQASIFVPTGGTIGTDTSAADAVTNMENVPPFSGGLPAEGTNMTGLNINALVSTFFDGNTMLYGLPPESDTTELSLSCWIVSTDFPGAGALFSSPALTYDQTNSHTANVSAVVSGAQLAICGSGADPYPKSLAAFPDDGGIINGCGQTWAHIMVSVKSNGDGTCTGTMYCNETQIYASQSEGDMVSHGDAFQFTSLPGGPEEPGLCVWNIGGSFVVDTPYDIQYQSNPPVASPGLTLPTLQEILTSIFNGLPTGNYYTLGSGDVADADATFSLQGNNLLAIPNYINYIKSVKAREAAQANQPVDKVVGGNGGLPNDPDQSGYVGSVDQLLIWPGKFIDWTSSTNRGYLHWYDTVADDYKPVSVGPNGGTRLGAPAIFLAGPPSVFNLNRATGKRLTVTGDDLQVSDYPPPSAS